MMPRVLGEMAWSSFWTSRPPISDIQISMTARATEFAPVFSIKRPLWTLIVPSVGRVTKHLFVEHAGNYAFEHVKLAWLCFTCSNSVLGERVPGRHGSKVSEQKFYTQTPGNNPY